MVLRYRQIFNVYVLQLVSTVTIYSSSLHFPFFDHNLCLLDVAAEKTQQTLMSGIEKFDPSSLKHTETQEKNLLPDKDGTVSYFVTIIYHFCFLQSLSKIANYI